MKKILAIILCLVTVLGLSVTAFAEKSPEGEVVITVYTAPGVKASKKTLKPGETVDLEADEGFSSWSIYKASDKTTAGEGVDYEYVSGSKSDRKVTIKALNDIIICANFGDKITDPSTGEAVSPKTADTAVIYLTIVMLAALAVSFTAKKQLSK